MYDYYKDWIICVGEVLKNKEIQIILLIVDLLIQIDEFFFNSMVMKKCVFFFVEIQIDGKFFIDKGI